MRTAEEIERTKDDLKTALFELMKKKDYQSITMSEIAQRAGYGRATLYRHFQSKEEIIKFYFEKNNIIFQEVHDISFKNNDDFYKIIFRVFSTLKNNKDIIKLLIAAHLEFMYLEFMNNTLVANFRKNKYETSKYAPYYFMGSLFNVSMQWVMNDCSEPVQQLADFYYSHMFSLKVDLKENL